MDQDMFALCALRVLYTTEAYFEGIRKKNFVKCFQTC